MNSPMLLAGAVCLGFGLPMLIVPRRRAGDAPAIAEPSLDTAIIEDKGAIVARPVEVSATGQSWRLQGAAMMALGAGLIWFAAH